MVHNRLNEHETHPNKHINFISALPISDVPSPYAEEDARQLLRALAAQVRPLMRDHGFEVNSLEEYEYNRVFAGRNWNNGETVELVLRRADGTFAPNAWLLSTLCHELAHIKHMNHGRDFQRLWAQLRTEVTALQAKGYFGDGLWSSGTRLTDSARVGGQGIEGFELPEYLCGGAQSRSRPKGTGRRRRIHRRVAGPSNRTGAQTEKRRKPGARVTAKGKFAGWGKALNADIGDEEEKAKGAGFRKQAGSKRAREERALAAEKRFKALQGDAQPVKTEKSPSEEESVTEGDSDYEESAWAPAETDEARRKTMRDTMDGDDLESMRLFMSDFLKENSPHKSGSRGSPGRFESPEALELSSGDDGPCDIPSTSNPVVPRLSDRPAEVLRRRPSPHPRAGPSQAPQRASSKYIGLGRLAEEEMTSRRRESLGLTGGQKLGSKPSPASLRSQAQQGNAPERTDIPGPSTRTPPQGWNCQVCTLVNVSSHLACSACGTPRWESAWTREGA